MQQDPTHLYEIKIKQVSQAQRYVCIVPAIQEAEAGGSLEPRSLRLAVSYDWAWVTDQDLASKKKEQQRKDPNQPSRSENYDV